MASKLFEVNIIVYVLMDKKQGFFPAIFMGINEDWPTIVLEHRGSHFSLIKSFKTGGGF
jgi:hypothetical protein